MAAIPMASSGFAPLISPEPIRQIFNDADKARRNQFEQFVTIISSDRSEEKLVEIAELGRAAEYADGSGVDFDRVLLGGTKKVEPILFGLGVAVTPKMRRFEHFGVIARLVQMLNEAARNAQEIETINLFEHAADASPIKRYQTIAGQSLLNTAHTQLGVAGGTQSNRMATDATISVAAAQELTTLITGLDSGRGFPLRYQPERALVVRDDEYIAAKVYKNAMRFDTGNREENWVRQGPDEDGVDRVSIMDYATSTNMHFVLAPKSQHTLRMYEYMRPTVDSTGLDFQSGNQLMKVEAWFNTTIESFQGVAGASGY